MKSEWYFPSSDGVTEIHVIEWKPEEVKAVLQICHGMVEYIDRYDEFANYLCDRGFYVVGNDHLGHGRSVQSEEELGYFEKTRGNECVIGDIQKLRLRTQEKYPDLPYFMLGHSMGSFLLRQYLTQYGAGLSGAIIMGTGHQPPATLKAGKALCRIIAKIRGGKYRSQMVANMAFANYNKTIPTPKTDKDWISSDETTVEAYIRDPYCTFLFTVNAYYHMFRGMETLNKPESMNAIPKNLPIYFVAGGDDPVGAYGRNVRKIYDKYMEAGILDVSIKLYPGDRHEILNEVDRQQVFEDLYRWMQAEI